MPSKGCCCQHCDGRNPVKSVCQFLSWGVEALSLVQEMTEPFHPSIYQRTASGAALRRCACHVSTTFERQTMNTVSIKQHSPCGFVGPSAGASRERSGRSCIPNMWTWTRRSTSAVHEGQQGKHALESEGCQSKRRPGLRPNRSEGRQELWNKHFQNPALDLSEALRGVAEWEVVGTSTAGGNACWNFLRVLSGELSLGGASRF